MLLEAEVHSSLRSFLREQGSYKWLHHLTMARLVARALRLERSILIQTGSFQVGYCISYLIPALLDNSPVIIVAPPKVQQQLLQFEIPELQKWLAREKEIRQGDIFPEDFQGIMLTSPQSWLGDRLTNQGRFPENITTIIDQADDLEEWSREQLTYTIANQDWQDLMLLLPQYQDLITNVRAKLTKSLFAHPHNPYQGYLMEAVEQEILRNLLITLSEILSPSISQFWQQWQTDNFILWASLIRETGQFIIHLSPKDVASILSSIWMKQTVVLIGGFLDWEANASIYRTCLGLGDILCLKFSPQKQSQHIQLYLPEHLPLPNTPQFQEKLIKEMLFLISSSSHVKKLVVLLVEDVPLKKQVGTAIAAQFGSRVQVEKMNLAEDGILVTGWEFWRVNQEKLPNPQLLVIATLPMPSLENPLVASRVAYHKRQRQDWFRLYLLPTALREIQRAVISLRESQGIVAILDNRVNYRSYGKQILAALQPFSRLKH